MIKAQVMAGIASFMPRICDKMAVITMPPAMPVAPCNIPVKNAAMTMDSKAAGDRAKKSNLIF